tara:strand:- start:524 stop:682 length:159 start_codon:yes stop_codon:yes gene_type:complete
MEDRNKTQEKPEEKKTEVEKRRVEKIYLMLAIFFALATLLLIKGLVLSWLGK